MVVVEITTKRCSKCDAELPLDQFHRRLANPDEYRHHDGYQSWCKTCKATANREGPVHPHGTTWWLPCSYCGETFERVAKQGERCSGNVYCGDRCRHKGARLMSKYGLSPAEFRAMWVQQAGMCAMPGCFAVLKLFGAAGHHVDHDHATGEVRGLLCHGCNTGLGHFERMVAVGAEFYLEGVMSHK